ncbi:MAG: permease [Candidatus Omnitrophica bacterium]|nr:permease [Candidatus Omnitrophota bacterium]
MSSSCCADKHKVQTFFHHKLFWLVLATLALLGASYGFSFLAGFRQAFLAYGRMVFWPLVLGLMLGGLIDYYVPREYVSVILSGKRKRNIFYAVVWGFLMTLCSHGILALAIQLYKKGAAPSAVVAFLLASPWANFPLTLMLAGFFGPLKAAYIILAAIVVALVTGWIFQVFEQQGMIEANPHAVDVQVDFDMAADFRARMAAQSRFDLRSDARGIAKGIWELSEMTLWWIMLGMILAAAAGTFIPPHIFHQFMGKSVGGMITTLAAATLIESCSSGTAPLAFEIYRQTGALGNALVFLMAGVATNYTQIGLLWANAGRRTALWLPVICVPLILIFGYIGNKIFF